MIPIGCLTARGRDFHHLGSHPGDVILAAVEVAVAFVVVGGGTCDCECGCLILGDDCNHNYLCLWVFDLNFIVPERV